MLDVRIYRAALVPVLLAVIVCAFSLQDQPSPVTTTLAPDAFSGGVRVASGDVRLLVELTELALGGARLGCEPLRGRFAAAERRSGECFAPEQVVPVAVRAEQPGGLPARLGEHHRQRVELLGQDRRVDDEALGGTVRVAAVDDRTRRLPEGATDDDDVGVDADGPH